jgi:hypothetical protein
MSLRKHQHQKLKEALRVLRLEESRLRSAALAYSQGLGSQYELQTAADYYTAAAVDYKALERYYGASLTPEQAEVVR